MNLFERYYLEISRQLECVFTTQSEAIRLAGQWIGAALAADRWVYAFGTGHSHLVAEEIFYRAGGLVRAVPILDEDLMLHKSAAGSTDLERKEEYAGEILSRYPVQVGDVLILISNSGRNAVPVEMALRAREMGLKTIAITNFQHSRAFPSRHSSGKRIMEAADAAIDNCGLPGDACVSLAGLDSNAGPASTILGAFIINAVILEGIQEAMLRNSTPELYRSSNADQDRHNDEILKKYRQRICHL